MYAVIWSSVDSIVRPNPNAPAPNVIFTAPLTNAPAVVVPRTGVKVDAGEGNKLALVREGVTLRELVDGLNALGIGPRDLISILQAIEAAGALQADIEVM